MIRGIALPSRPKSVGVTDLSEPGGIAGPKKLNTIELRPSNQ